MVRVACSKLLFFVNSVDSTALKASTKKNIL